MASLYGFQMKNIKNTLGIEGQGCLASMYLNGKKIGSYKDYGDGGISDISYNTKEDKIAMIKLVIEYAKTHSSEYLCNFYKQNPERYSEEVVRFKRIYPFINESDITIETMSTNSEEFIVSDFLKLYDDEKTYKKQLKKGYTILIINQNTGSYASIPESWDEKRIKKYMKENNLPIRYNQLEDFVIQ